MPEFKYGDKVQIYDHLYLGVCTIIPRETAFSHVSAYELRSRGGDAKDVYILELSPEVAAEYPNHKGIFTATEGTFFLVEEPEPVTVSSNYAGKRVTTPVGSGVVLPLSEARKLVPPGCSNHRGILTAGVITVWLDDQSVANNIFTTDEGNLLALNEHLKEPIVEVPGDWNVF